MVIWLRSTQSATLSYILTCSSNWHQKSRSTRTSVVLVMPIGSNDTDSSIILRGCLVGATPLMRARSEYGPLALSEWILYMDLTLAKSGRNVGIEAAMMPRLLSNLVSVSAAVCGR